MNSNVGSMHLKYATDTILLKMRLVSIQILVRLPLKMVIKVIGSVEQYLRSINHHLFFVRLLLYLFLYLFYLTSCQRSYLLYELLAAPPSTAGNKSCGSEPKYQHSLIINKRFLPIVTTL